MWFANDDVRLSDDHLPYLASRFDQASLHECLAPVPYIGAIMPRVPYYRFVGTRRALAAGRARTDEEDEEESEDQLPSLSNPGLTLSLPRAPARGAPRSSTPLYE